MKKILFSDIDGTVLNEQGPICQKDSLAIQKLRQAKHYFVLCTGRNFQEVQQATKYFAYDYLILNNGAMIVDNQDCLIYQKQMPNKIIKTLLADCLLRYPNLYYTFYDGVNTYAYFGKNKSAKLTSTGYQLIDADFQDLLKKSSQDFDIICAYHPQGALNEILEIQQHIKNHYPEIQGTLNTIYLDITVANCSKGTGIQTLLKSLAEEVITYGIGDSYNDLSMFKVVDHPYTFKNVNQEIKKETENQVNYVYEIIQEMLEEENQ